MPVKLLDLDDRTYADLFAEARALIPRYAPDWTDHNTSDPGIMLLELFAWLTESLLYRINRVSDASRAQILELLGAAFQPAQPAMLSLRVRVEPWPKGVDQYEMPREQLIWGHTASGTAVPFEVMRTVKFTQEDYVREVILRQTQLVPSREASPDKGSRQLAPPPGRALARTKAGHPFELVGVGDQFLVLPPEPHPWRPRLTARVTVNDESWMLVDSLQDLEPASACCYALIPEPEPDAVAFGGERKGVNGKIEEPGRIPPKGAKIRVTYRWSPAPRAVVTDEFTSTGEAGQIHRLSRPLCRPNLRAPSDLEPCLVSQEAGGASTTWKYVAHFLDMTAGAAHYTFEPWHNALRFGGDRYGKPVSPSALLSLRGRFTLGVQGNLPRDSGFRWPPSAAGDKLRPGMAVDSWEILAQGKNPTTLDEARHQIDAMLRPGWRAVTADDFESVIRNNLPNIARIIRLPGHRTSDDEGRVRPGTVGIIVIPDRTAELTASTQQLSEILASAPDTRRLVAEAGDGTISLWNIDTGEPVRKRKRPGVNGAAFSPNGRRFLTCMPGIGASSSTWTAELWDVRTGARLKYLKRNTSPAHFSTTGRWLVTMHKDGARLRDANDGATIHPLPGARSWDCLAFGPDDTSLLAAYGDQAHSWILADGQEPHDVLADAQAKPGGPNKRDETGWAGPFSAAAYSREGTCAAVAAENGHVRAWQFRPDPVKVLAVRRQVDIELGYRGPAHSLLLDPAGTRVITQSAGGITALWSARTGALLADLSLAGPVDLLALSGDGKWLATAHADHTVRIWDAVSGGEIAKLAHDAAVEAMVFAPNRPQFITITSAHKKKYVLGAWSLESGAIRKIATRAIDDSSPPIIHASGRWLAYADERLVHVWDTTRAADISAIYVDFDDPAIVMDAWRLDPTDSLPHRPLGVQVAAATPIALTGTRHLRVTSALELSEGKNRTVQFWDAEHVYRAEEVLADRRLVTTRVEVSGPTYTGVKVNIVVVRRSPTIAKVRLEDRIEAALFQFFDPLHGGKDGAGWPLGRPVYISEICQVVEAVDGVDHVENVSLENAQDPEQLAIPPHSLVKCNIEVEVRP